MCGLVFNFKIKLEKGVGRVGFGVWEGVSSEVGGFGGLRRFLLF